MGIYLFLLGCLLLSSPSLTCQSSHTRRDHGSAYHLLKVHTLLPAPSCTSPSKGNNHTSRLTVVSRGGPCSFTSTSSSAPTSLSQLLLEDESRAATLRHRMRQRHHQYSTTLSSSSSANLPIHPGSSLGTGNYVATISLGTPKRHLTVILDTGSDLTWVQCKPCLDHCHSQDEPLFEPSLSTTFSNASCSSPSCSSLLSATGSPGTCASGLCLYSISYGDGSYSVGILSRDILSLSHSSRDALPSFLFGCGESNRGLFGRTAGLLGLGRDRISLVSQTASTYRRVFSYCLPTRSSTGHLSFGLAAASSVASFTPMLTDPLNPSLYFLDLVAIRVGGRKLPVPSTTFQRTIVDSGTVITRLPPTAYSALRGAFRRGMSGYQAAAAYSILDTCFDLSRYTTVSVPKIVLVFRGRAVLEVAAVGTLVGPSKAQLCLAFAGNDKDDDVGIVGNMQQMTVDVVYDVGRARIGFAAGGCR